MRFPPATELAARLAGLPAMPAVLEAAAARPGVWLVGGAVRDLLRGEHPVDIDVAVEGDALAFAAELGPAAEVHDRFGTAAVLVAGERVNVAAARTERYPAPGALPEVAPASIDEDLARRDFTVNAIAAALWEEERGALRAFPGAEEDLAAGLLRVLHDRSFVDDPTRLLRLVRYEARLGFAAEPGTEALARDAIAAGAVATVSPSRTGGELRLLLREPAAGAALRRCRELGLDRALHPRMAFDAELADAALSLLPDYGRSDLLLLGCCCRAFDAGELRQWLDSLELRAVERDVVVATALDAGTLAESLRRAQRPSEIAAAARGRPVEQAALAGALGPREAARRWLEDLRPVRLEITGADLIAAGVPEGPALGRALDAALAQRLDGELPPGRDAEREAALRAARAEGPG